MGVVVLKTLVSQQGPRVLCTSTVLGSHMSLSLHGPKLKFLNSGLRTRVHSHLPTPQLKGLNKNPLGQSITPRIQPQTINKAKFPFLATSKILCPLNQPLGYIIVMGILYVQISHHWVAILKPYTDAKIKDRIMSVCLGRTQCTSQCLSTVTIFLFLGLP